MSKQFVLGLVFSIVAFSLPCLSELPEYQDLIPDFGGLQSAEVIHITDGGTVEFCLAGEETSAVYRLAGVDTPEVNAVDKADEPYGKEAHTFLRNLLKGESVWVEHHGTGIHNRPVVSLFRVPDGLFVNLEIVRQGYGEVYVAGEFDKKQLFLDYQEFAQKAKKGIWAEEESIEGSGEVWIASSGQGKKYHRTPDCQYIRDKNVRISLEEAKRRGLEPCKRCKPDE
ncbi:thermonuclease family protein [Candidatus Poribacteria bacterium]